jgi:hypothetical protein
VSTLTQRRGWLKGGLAAALALCFLVPAVAARTSTEAVARRYMKAIAARDLDAQPMAPDALFRDRTAEFFDLDALVSGVQGPEAIVALQTSWNLEKIDFDVELEFFAGEWAVFAGAATLTTRGKPGSRPMGFLTLLRVQQDQVSERHDFWNYADGFPPSDQQKANAKATEKVAGGYLKAYLEQRFDDAHALMAADVDFQDPTAALFGPNGGRKIQGPKKLTEARRATFGNIIEFGLDVKKTQVANRHAIYIGRTHYTMPGSLARSKRDVVRFEHPAVFVIGVQDGKVAYHRDFVDYSDFGKQAEAQRTKGQGAQAEGTQE